MGTRKTHKPLGEHKRSGATSGGKLDGGNRKKERHGKAHSKLAYTVSKPSEIGKGGKRKAGQGKKSKLHGEFEGGAK